MAATLEAVPSGDGRSLQHLGSRRIHTARVTFDASYPTGGEAVDFRPLGVQDDANAIYIFQQRAPITVARVYVYDRTNRKLLAFEEEAVAAGGGLVEVPNTTDLSAVIVDVLIIGA